MKKPDKGLSAWQLTMMALGTVVGGSFFLGSAVAIRTAGPGIVILAMSSEATAVSIVLQTWFPGISLALLGSIVIIAVSFLNLLGADQLSKLESGLAAVKLVAIVGFIVLGIALISGFMPGTGPVGVGELAVEPLLPGGFWGIAGSMLIVIFTYAGFEVIGLAATEARNPHETVPKAIRYTVISLVGLYVVSILVLLPLIPTSALTVEQSPLAAALARWNLAWAGNIITIVLVTAILSTMLAAMFGLGRMIRSLADEGHAPSWVKDEGDIPYRGIIFSGTAMLVGLGLGFMLPQQVYLFLVSSGGFALLFSYVVILATHYKMRKINGCPPKGNCQLPGYPTTSWLALAGILLIIASMPLIPGQGAGLAAGLVLVILFSVIYIGKKLYLKKTVQSGQAVEEQSFSNKGLLQKQEMQFEIAKEVAIDQRNLQKRKKKSRL